jgi:hypothetical protein
MPINAPEMSVMSDDSMATSVPLVGFKYVVEFDVQLSSPLWL